ncbi:hypothetical protein [Microvirga massiliensis]|uniref:hypothetical protein n=1 Tax=Microvirga massiliensis TaxID=1033741 RepID=UPI00065F7B37|nr:hypothetical protein [Microvirga massiliensis]
MFTIPAASGFEIAQPWSLELSIEPPRWGGMVPAIVDVPYRLPDKYFPTPEPPATVPETQVIEPMLPTGRAPAPPEPTAPAWLAGGIGTGLVALSALIVAFVVMLALLQPTRATRSST